jgi:predicted restriction endonuclease
MIRQIIEKISEKDDMMNLGDFNHKKLMEEDSDYQEFFQKKLKQWGVKSPAELDKEKRKKFFAEVSKEWK